MFKNLLIFCIAFSFVLSFSTHASTKKLTRVLCLASYDTKVQGLDSIDPEAVKKYAEMGYELHFDYYQKIKPETIYSYPVVVGMIPQLHAGTNPISPKLATAIDNYLKKGGGFILIPAPSYYGGEDFVKQLNPWLKKYGVQLLNEIPQDPAHQEELVRVLAYRYLSTTNLKKHPVTAGINKVWLPLSFSNNYLRTHTMTISPEWQAVVNGEATTVTYPFSKIRKGNMEPGTYQTEPPFLAVRKWGRGHLAVFTTASRYFVFDAYHRAFGDGFVMKNGGLKLMTNLFKYVSANAGKFKEATVTKSEKMSVIKGNVPIIIRKAKWLEFVLKNYMPKEYGVKYYVDCGALSDLPYSPSRQFGYVDIPYTNWLIRWAWSEIFHATASNSRAFDIKELKYRFDALQENKTYKLGIMVWAYQHEGARDVVVKSNGKIIDVIELPKFKDQQGPLFKVIDIPAAVANSKSITLTFSRGKNGSGVFSSVCELWLWEKDAPALSSKAIIGRFESPSAGVREAFTDLKNFEGLIGAVSNHCGGRNTVAEMAQAAKEAGLQFLIFTDPLNKLTAAKLEKLRADCKAASSDDFTALPGIQLSAGYADKNYVSENPNVAGKISAYFWGAVRQLPTVEALKSPYSLFWKFFGGEYCAGKRTPANLLTPGRNGISPFFQRFWRGLDVLTFDVDGKITDDSRKLFDDLLASGYGPYPRVSGKYLSVKDIKKATKGWKVAILARDQKVMPLYHYSSCVSNGPKILKYAFSFDHMREAECGGGILFRDNAWVYANIKLTHTAPLTDVKLYKNGQLIRHWRPNKKIFEILEPLKIAEQAELSMHVKAADGTEARTGRFQTLDHSFMNGMCADNQNSICNLTRKPSAYQRDERELYLQHSYWHTGEAAGQLGVMVDYRELVPRIIETGIVQLCKNFIPMPEIHLSNGKIEKQIFAEMRIVGGSRDYNQVQYKYNTPDCYLKTKLKITNFRPHVNGSTAVLLEGESVAQKDIGAGELKKLRILSMAMMPPLPSLWKYTCINSKNELVTGEFASLKRSSKAVELNKKSGIMIWPNDLANLMVFPLDDNSYTVSFDNLKGVWNGREHFELNSNIKGLKREEKFSWRILVLLNPADVKTAEALFDFKKQFTEFYRKVEVKHGKLLKADYVIDVEAEDNCGVFEFTESSSVLVPLRLRNLNDNVSSGIVTDGKIKLLGTNNGILNGVVKAIPGKEIFAGNLIVCDNPNVIVEWAGTHLDGVRLHVHNPTQKTLDVKLGINKSLRNFMNYQGKLKIKAGESIWIWGRDAVSVVENTGFQVKAVDLKGKSMNIITSGNKLTVINDRFKDTTVN